MASLASSHCGALATGHDAVREEPARVEGAMARSRTRRRARPAARRAQPSPTPVPRSSPLRRGPKRAVLEVGFCGQPNVGKSSAINVLMGAKCVRTGATPGKTKHFQTLKLSAALTLCDCPGLVMPTLVSSKADMVLQQRTGTCHSHTAPLLPNARHRTDLVVRLHTAKATRQHLDVGMANTLIHCVCAKLVKHHIAP